MKMKAKNINKPTPAKWAKIGMALVAASSAIAGYGLTAGDRIIGYIGVGLSVLGSFISNLFSDEK